MFIVSWGCPYTHSRWSVSRHGTHDGPPLCWSSFTGALILVLHGQCVTQVARGDIVIILDWSLCDFLVMKHIDEVDALHLHLSLTYFLCGKYSRISILLFIIYWYWLFFMWKCSYYSWLMFMWFSVTETYWWSGCTSSSFVIYCFWLFTHVDYFSCAKCSYHSRLMFMWFSVTETYWWSGCTSSSFVFTDVDMFQYCFWLFTHVDYFSCAKCSYHSRLMFMWFSCTETYWWSGCTSSFVIYYFWLFTDVDYFSCENVFIILDWCLYDFLVLKHIELIYWCWHIFVWKLFHNFNIAFDYLLMLTIVYVPKFP